MEYKYLIKKVMMKQSYFYLSLAFYSISCQEVPYYHVMGDKEKPGQVTVNHVRAIPGGAVIHYQSPPDPDLLYIEANYTLNNGRKMKVRASKYVDSLRIEGFAEAEQYPVTLHAVDKGRNASEKTKLNVHPLVSPISTVYASLKLTATFGGVNLQWKNKQQAPMAFIMRQRANSLKTRVPLQLFETLYSDLAEGNQSFRGFSVLEQEFAVQLRDRWGNLSDTLKAFLTPIQEIYLDRSLFRPIYLPGDVEDISPLDRDRQKSLISLFNFTEVEDRKLEEKNITTDHLANAAVFAEERTLKGNMRDGGYHFTFDLGVTTQLSRMKLWQFYFMTRPEFLYNAAQVEKFEIWGHSEPLDLTDGSFQGWTLLKEDQVVKPSGLPLGDNSEKDKQAALAGHDLDFSIHLPKVRYIRIKIKKTFANTSYGLVGEVAFWGQI